MKSYSSPGISWTWIMGLSICALVFIALPAHLGAQDSKTSAGNPRGNSADNSLTGDQVVELMRANDAQFDNILVEYRHSEYPKAPPFRARKSGGGRIQMEIASDIDQSTLPSRAELFKLATRSNPELYRSTFGEMPELSDTERKWVSLIETGKIKFIATKEKSWRDEPPTVLDIRLALRWPDLCAERKRVSPELPDTISETRKWKSIGQRLDHLDQLGRNSTDWIRATRVQPIPLNGYQELTTWVKFAFGVGYGSLIRSVKSLDTSDGYLILNADLEIWQGHMCHAVLYLDDRYIVRRAEIDAGASRMDVTTSETYSAPDIPFFCANRGTFFRRFGSSMEPNPKFDVVMQRIQFALTDQDFFALAGMDVPAGHQVKTIDQDELVAVQPNAAAPPHPTSRLWLVIANVVFLGLVAYFWRLTRRTHAV